MMSDEEVKIMKEFEDNRNYFDKNISGNPLYQGKFVAVDKKNVAGVFENNKTFTEALKKIGKTAYYNYVHKENEGEALNT